MAFFFTCIYIFLMLLRPQEWFFPDYWPANAMDIVVIAGLIMLVGDLVRRRVILNKYLPQLWLMVGLVAAALLSDIMLANFGNLVRTATTFAKIFIIFVLLLLTCTTVQRVRMVAGIYLLIALFIVLHCWMQIHTGAGFGGAEPLIQRDAGGWFPRVRYFGIMGDPNDTSLFFTLAMPLAFIVLPWRNYLTYLVMAVIAGLLIYGVILTQSRGGYLAMAVMIFAIIILYTRSRRLVIWMICGAIFLLMALPSRLASIGVIQQDRSILWGSANQIFKQHPLTGVGMNRSPEYMEVAWKAPHNSFVHAYTELGVIGYFFWFSLLVFCIYSCWRVSKMVPEDKTESMLVEQSRAIFCSLVGFAGAAYFLSRSYFIPFYVLLAMAASVYNLTGGRVGLTKLNEHCGFSRQRIWFYPAMSLASIFCIYLTILVINRL